MEDEEIKLEKKGYVAISANVKRLLADLAKYHKTSEEEVLAVALLRLEAQDKAEYLKEYKKAWAQKKKAG